MKNEVRAYTNRLPKINRKNFDKSAHASGRPAAMAV
jgi:hypothetical protein